MDWIKNTITNKPRYGQLVVIRTIEGEEYIVKLIHFNPKYHARNPVPDRWRREDDVPKKQRWIDDNKVAEWREI